MLDHPEIRALLPQDHPMVLVDRVLSLDLPDQIVSIKAITGTEACYRDLPRDLPPECYAYPASLLLESFGQTGALLWLKSTQALANQADQVLLFVAARDCKFEGRAFPGDVVRHVARLDHRVGDHFFITGDTWIEQRRIATFGSLIATVRSRFSTGAGSHSSADSTSDPFHLNKGGANG